MRLICRSPFRYRPERIHHSARPVGELIGEPPLRAERRMRPRGKPLEICHPVIGPVSRFLICNISGPRVIQSLDRSQPRAMAVAALVRQVAAEVLWPAPLLCRHHCAVHHILRPLRRRLYPLHQLAARAPATAGSFSGCSRIYRANSSGITWFMSLMLPCTSSKYPTHTLFCIGYFISHAHAPARVFL